MEWREDARFSPPPLLLRASSLSSRSINAIIYAIRLEKEARAEKDSPIKCRLAKEISPALLVHIQYLSIV